MNQINFDTLDLNLLKVLAVILEERSVTRAGARLGITQSAASHCLNRLRAALQDDLVVRTPSGMHPTALGTEIAAALPGALEGLKGALAAPHFAPQSSQRVFTIIAGPYACAVILPRLMARVLGEAPGVRMQVRGYGSDMIDQLDRGNADLMFTRYGAGPDHLHQEPVLEEDFVWVVRARHALADKIVTLAALCAWPHVVIDNPQTAFDPNEGGRGAARGAGRIDQGAFQNELDRQGLKQSIGLIVPDTQSALAVVGQTDMAALVPRRLALMRPPVGALKIIAPPYEAPRLRIGFVTRRDRLQAPDTAWLLDCLRTVTASMAA